MEILDTTIRDGSYAVDFKISCTDVEQLVEKDEKLGIKYIEIGHGLGLNASSMEHGFSLHTDIEYMQAAQNKIINAQYGFFCIPGIARLEDLKSAKEQGVSFVRIGVNADSVSNALEYVRYAKSIGLTVMINFMKSYLVNPEDFAENAIIAEENGANYVYLVDSAGCMMPEQIQEYYSEVRKRSKIRLGFHGHNNLGLAVYNSIYCAELGFDLIDCSFQGIGRSLGNTSVEMFVMSMKKRGYNLNMDIPRLLEYGFVIIKDLMGNKSISPLDLICGYTGFHSSFLKDIYRCCERYKVDPLRLILAYSAYSIKEMDYQKLCNIAQELPIDLEIHPYNFREFFSNSYKDI